MSIKSFFSGIWDFLISEVFCKGLVDEVADLKQKMQDLRGSLDGFEAYSQFLQLENLKKAHLIKNLEEQNDVAKEKIDELVKEKYLDILSLRSWYEFRRSQSSWRYNGVRLGFQDVVVYLKPRDMTLFTAQAKDIIKRYGLDKDITSPTEAMTMNYRYWNLRSSWRYKTDILKFNSVEWWEDPTDAMNEREGDCESKAMCMYWTGDEVLRLLGLEEHDWRLTFIAANTAGFGHAVLTWLYEDGEYYVMESTYDKVNSKFKTWLRTPMRFNNLYGAPWGFANKYRSWLGTNSALLNFKDA